MNKRKLVLPIAVVSVLLFVKFPNGNVQVTMLDVGQGDCIFVKGPKGSTYLIDGGSSDVEQVGKYRIEPFLKSQGIGKLDYVFLSHGDLDHYNGIKEMLGRQLLGVKIERLVLPSNYGKDEKLLGILEIAKENGIDVWTIEGGQMISEGELELRCLQPTKNRYLDGNAGSMVLELSFGSFDMLFTGDVELEGETELERNLHGKSYDVLKVAHHGSKNSTQDSLLEILRPKVALISAGENNSYGHPHSETIERLEKWNCRIYQTVEQGAIMLETNGDFIDIFPSSI